jgi:hypothetical protein
MMQNSYGGGKKDSTIAGMLIDAINKGTGISSNKTMSAGVSTCPPSNG